MEEEIDSDNACTGSITTRAGTFNWRHKGNADYVIGYRLFGNSRGSTVYGVTPLEPLLLVHDKKQ